MKEVSKVIRFFRRVFTAIAPELIPGQREIEAYRKEIALLAKQCEDYEKKIVPQMYAEIRELASDRRELLAVVDELRIRIDKATEKMWTGEEPSADTGQPFH